MKENEKHSGIGFFGSIIVDRVLDVEAWPSEGTLGLISGQETLGTGGSAWNDPVNLRAIDPDIPLFSCGVVGDDAMGRFAREHLQERAIDTRHIEVNSNADTSYSIVSNSAASGLRTHLHATGACDLFDLHHLEAFPENLRIAHLGYLMLLSKLEAPSGSETRAVEALRILQKKANKVAIDIVSLDQSRARFQTLITPCLPYIDYLIINEFEAGEIVGTDLRDGADQLLAKPCVQVAHQLLDMGVRDTVIIHFPEGALGISKTESVFTPSFDIAPADINCVVGAGDAFASATLYGLYENKGLEHSLLLGNANARHNIVSSSCTDGVVPLSVLEETVREEPRRDPVIQNFENSDEF